MTLALPKPTKPVKVCRPLTRNRTPIVRTRRPRPRSTRLSSVVRRVNDDAWSKRVRERARHRCEITGGGLRARITRCTVVATDAHHLYGKLAHPALRFELANGVSCCRSCHNWAHANRLDIIAWFRVARPMDWARLHPAGQL